MKFFLAVNLVVAGSLACAQTTPAAPDPAQTPVRPTPIPTGVVPLPGGTPPIGMQAPVPNPAATPRAPFNPFGWSPQLNQVKGFLADHPITIDQAVAISLYTSRNFESSVASLEQAAGMANEVRAALIPNLSVNETLNYYDKATTVNFGSLIGGGGTTTTTTTASPPFVVLPQFNPVFSASLSLPIDLFGAIRSAVSQADFNAVAARIDVNRVRNQTVYDVKTAFYNVLRASAQAAVAKDNLKNSLERLDDANKNYAAGTSSRFDITTAQRDVADAQQSLITAQSQVSINLSNLKNVMGLDVSSRLTLSNDGAVEFPNGVLPPLVPEVDRSGHPLSSVPPIGSPNPLTQNPEVPQVAPPIDRGNLNSVQPSGYLDPSAHAVVGDEFDFGPDYKKLTAEALSNRPEVLQAEAQINATKKGLTYAFRSQLPSISLSLQDTYFANVTPLERQNQSAVVLGISVPLIDGGTARARVREQRAIIAQAEVSRENARSQVIVDVQEAYIALVQTRQKVAVANVEVSNARESYRVSRVRYRAGVSGQTGVSPQLELSNAQISLSQAESNVVNALFDYNNARAQLDKALGRYSFTGVGPGYKSKDEIPGHKK